MNRPVKPDIWTAPRAIAAPFRWRLIVMVKAPVAGRVKTRLARDLGTATATRFYRATSRAVIGRLAHDPRWVTTLAVAPDAAIACRAWPHHLARTRQGQGDLGQRMQRAIDRAPLGPVILIGTDIPDVRPALIAGAFRLLGRHDAVFGPATDGGFWLAGARRRPRTPRMFQQVRWSSPETLADTVRNLAGLRVAHAARLADVDTACDFRVSGSRSGRRILPR